MEKFTHPRDENIRFFKDSHRYLHDTRGELKGVTKWAKNYVKKFDSDGIAKYLAYKRGCTKQDILDEWALSTEYGNVVHNAFETLLETGEVVLEAQSEIEGILTMADLLELEPVRAEWVIYSDEINNASAIDGVFKNKKGEIVIVDFKTYKEMTFEGYKGQTMFPPLDHLPDSKYWMTSLQISIYADWLRKFYDIPVADTHFIFHINREVTEYHPAFDLSSEVQLITNELRGSQV
jgi:hypothetical protein